MQVGQAAPVASGWSSFETGKWEPEIQWPSDKKPAQKRKSAKAEVRAATRYEGTIADGKLHETTYYVYDSGQPGPTVMVTGGMHGNEPAGARAASEVKDYWVRKGRLIVIPELNRPALQKNTRTSSIGDLNRDFPRTKSESADNFLAKGIWDIVKKYKPNWLIDMHEGWGYHNIDSSSVGQSVIYYPHTGVKTVAVKMTDAANRNINSYDQIFVTLKYPVKGSLARAASIVYGTHGMIVETCNKQPLAQRVWQHKAALGALLNHLDMQ